MHSWWESISKARTRIHLLSTLLPETSSVLSFLADSDCPARSLLLSSAAYSSISSSLSSPSSGSDDDSLCLWLYDTFLSADSELHLVVLCYIPFLSSFYLSRIHSSSTTSAISPPLISPASKLSFLSSTHLKSRLIRVYPCSFQSLISLNLLFITPLEIPLRINRTPLTITPHNRAREAVAAAAAASATTNANTPSKAKKPEILLVSK
ncbi:unnamed protein product [Coffea canephora]|uniref:DH200=94 genomic scaffold, scaffold_12325 n=1 Tax=Coffea canephora TaxID=49390 RepID=A0A068VNP3_COFCA|nr:unnamed protein product [Coffea canephora]